MSSEITIVIPSTTIITIALVVFILVTVRLFVFVTRKLITTDLRYWIELFVTEYVWQHLPLHVQLTATQWRLVHKIRQMDEARVEQILDLVPVIGKLANEQVQIAQAFEALVRPPQTQQYPQEYHDHDNRLRRYRASLSSD